MFSYLSRFIRKRNRFDPSHDKNIDSIINTRDGSLINKYVRKDENSHFSGVGNEHTKYSNNEHQLQNEVTITNSKTDILLYNGFITTPDKSKNSVNKADQNANKNLCSNNNNLIQSSNIRGNANKSCIIYKCNINNNYSQKEIYKQVRERRPTALPTENLHLNYTVENDEKQSEELSESKDQLDLGLNPAGDETSASSTPSSDTNAVFFICNKYEEDDDCSSILEMERGNNSTNDIINNESNVRPGFQRSAFQAGAKYSIPQPPPLPTTPLITPSLSFPTMSHKNGMCSCSTFRKSSATHEDLAIDGQLDKNQTESPETNAYIKKPNSTILFSENKETIQSHRVEGGVIFARSNLPEKKNVDIVVIKKDEKTRNIIRTAIERNDFLSNYMDNERKELVIDAMSQITFEKDSIIIHENDDGSEIFVAEEGFFDVIKCGKIVGSISPMNVFGELAILYNAKRQATIKASTNAVLWKIERENFREIMKISGSKERQENLNFLKTAPFLNNLSEEVLTKVVDLLRKKFFETDTCIVREGEVGSEFFIIRGGTVTIRKKNKENIEKVVDRRKRGDYFGEQALLNSDCRQASVYADAPGAEVLILEREAFISYLGTIPQLHDLPTKRDLVKEEENKRLKSEFDNEFGHVQLSELKKISTLGAGAFGRVDLVSYGEKTFALKIIKKIDVVKQDQVEHIYNEKNVMIECHTSPFIIDLYKTFRNEKFVYFLMEACMGGDVWTVMSQRKYFDEKTARFISGCVVEAFDFLHSMNIIYRDLKPENLMLTTDGYCKLVDFGFAKQIPNNQKTNTFAGTPEYVAPEIILDRGHDRSADYWALGILVFELLVGRTPFRGQTQIKIYQQILGGINVIQMPNRISKTAQNLIRSLCKQLPAERLGYQRRGIHDIKRHSWFEGLDWNKLRNKHLISPIRRPIANSSDTQYFVPIGVETDTEPPDEMSGWDIDF